VRARAQDEHVCDHDRVEQGRYHVRDALRVPSLVSFTRVIFAAVFPFCLHFPWLALGVLGAAALSDVFDGWYARRFDQVTALGTVIDPVTDKVFVTTVAISLVVSGGLSLFDVLLLSAREVGELPLVIWLFFSHTARSRREGANVIGKLATALQFVAIAVTLLLPRFNRWVIFATAVVGSAAAISYWRRALRPA
jgi:cardiolipin synthase (CMP-forming)